MRSGPDALRSLQKYTSQILPDWEVRPLTEEGTFERPQAQVQATAPEAIDGPPHRMDYLQPFAVYAYPEPQDTIPAGWLEASRVAELFVHAIRIGIGLGHPALIPLWDWDGVSFAEDTDARTSRDYMKVRDFHVERVQNPTDESLWSVVVEMRLAWSRTGRMPTGRTAREIRVTQTPG